MCRLHQFWLFRGIGSTYEEENIVMVIGKYYTTFMLSLDSTLHSNLVIVSSLKFWPLS